MQIPTFIVWFKFQFRYQEFRWILQFHVEIIVHGYLLLEKHVIPGYQSSTSCNSSHQEETKSIKVASETIQLPHSKLFQCTKFNQNYWISFWSLRSNVHFFNNWWYLSEATFFGSIQNDKRPWYTFCDKPYFLSGRLTKQKRSVLIQFSTF